MKNEHWKSGKKGRKLKLTKKKLKMLLYETISASRININNENVMGNWTLRLYVRHLLPARNGTNMFRLVDESGVHVTSNQPSWRAALKFHSSTARMIY